MRTRHLGVLMALTAALAALAAPVHARLKAHPRPSVKLSQPLPRLVRINEVITVRGDAKDAPGEARAALQGTRSGPWSTLSQTHLGSRGAFTIRWRVSQSETTGRFSLRVVALKNGSVIASSPVQQPWIGPAAIYCKPPPSPGKIPPGDGFITGGTYGEGGAYPGEYACYSDPYTLTVTNTHGTKVSSQEVPPRSSYTIVLPAGSYTLHGPCQPASATVTAGKHTVANTYCLYP